MGIEHPYRRTVRPSTNGRYHFHYVKRGTTEFEATPFIRSAVAVQKDFIELFEYIEPSDRNLSAFSIRTHALLVRTCIEIESNFKAILKSNEYPNNGKWGYKDFKKIEVSHFLSKYRVIVPYWRDEQKMLHPLKNWGEEKPPDWWSAYNKSKHDRQASFHEANFGNLTMAITALVALISAQFGTEDFSPFPSQLVFNGPVRGFDAAIGGHFLVGFPESVSITDSYNFDATPGNTNIIFQNFPYPLTDPVPPRTGRSR